MPYEKDENEIGALWSKSGNRGEYLTGEITLDGTKTKVVCFLTNATGERAHRSGVCSSQNLVSEHDWRIDRGDGCTRCARCGADLDDEPSHCRPRRLSRMERLQAAADAGYDTWEEYRGEV